MNGHIAATVQTNALGSPYAQGWRSRGPSPLHAYHTPRGEQRSLLGQKSNQVDTYGARTSYFPEVVTRQPNSPWSVSQSDDSSDDSSAAGDNPPMSWRAYLARLFCCGTRSRI